jgi:glutathione S-transferase
VFRYFDVFDALGDFGIFEHLPKVKAWRAQLALRPSVRQAVRVDHADLLRAFLRARSSALSKRLP